MLEKYPDILTVDEIMEILFISRNTAYKLLRDGKIHCFKIGKIWRVPRLSLEKYIKCQKN